MSVESFRTVQNDSKDWVRMVLAWCETTGYETTGYDKFESNGTIWIRTGEEQLERSKLSGEYYSMDNLRRRHTLE